MATHSGSLALVVFPVLGGMGLLLGGAVAMYVDRLLLLQQSQRRAQHLRRAPDLVLVRYLSAAIGDPEGLPHRIFFVGVTVYMIGLTATSCLQAQVLANTVSDSTMQQILLIFYAVFSGISGIMMVVGAHLWRPGSVKALVFHSVFACGFMVCGFLYGTATISLATDVFGAGSTVRAVRTGFAIAGGVGCVFNFLFAGAAGYGSIRIVQHNMEEDAAIERATERETGISSYGNHSEDSSALDVVQLSNGGGGGGTRLTLAQIRKFRCLELVFAIGQMIIGISLSVFTATGAAEMAIFPGGNAMQPSA